MAIRRKILDKSLYRISGLAIIVGSSIHVYNFFLLCFTGYYLLAIPNSLGLLLCATGSSRWPHAKIGRFQLRVGTIMSSVCFILFFSEHLFLNVAVEVFGFILNGLGNYYRIQSLEPK